MPAAAIILAPIAYIKVITVKKLIIKPGAGPICLSNCRTDLVELFLLKKPMPFSGRGGELEHLP